MTGSTSPGNASQQRQWVHRLRVHAERGTDIVRDYNTDGPVPSLHRRCNPWAYRGPRRLPDPVGPAGRQQGPLLPEVVWHRAQPDVLGAPVGCSTRRLRGYSVDGFLGEAAINITDVVSVASPRCLSSPTSSPAPSPATRTPPTTRTRSRARHIGANCETTTVTTPGTTLVPAIPAMASPSPRGRRRGQGHRRHRPRGGGGVPCRNDRLHPVHGQHPGPART